MTGLVLYMTVMSAPVLLQNKVLFTGIFFSQMSNFKEVTFKFDPF